MPFFSIITCTYNSGKYIQQNINSVSSQNFKDYEHIFIDGYSSDNTIKQIKEYQNNIKNKNQVKLVQSEAKGISNAMNIGINQAKGKYIIHLNSDDYFFDNNVLMDVYNFISKHSQIDWLYGKANVIEEDGAALQVYPDKPFFHYHYNPKIKGKYLMKILNFVPHQSVFIKKDIFEKFGYFDESINSMMDPDMWKRINYKTNWVFYNRIICNYTLRKDAQSSGKKNLNENRKNLRLIQKRHFNKIEYYLSKILNIIQEKRNNGNR